MIRTALESTREALKSTSRTKRSTSPDRRRYAAARFPAVAQQTLQKMPTASLFCDEPGVADATELEAALRRVSGVTFVSTKPLGKDARKRKANDHGVIPNPREIQCRSTGSSTTSRS